MAYSSPYSSPFQSPYRSSYGDSGGGVPLNILIAGDSWMSNATGFQDALRSSMPNVVIDGIATSGEKLYGVGQIMADLESRLAAPAAAYNTAIIEGGANDWEQGHNTFTLQLWKDAYVTMIDQCFAHGIANVCAVSSLPLADVWDQNAAGNSVWEQMVADNAEIPAIWLEFDQWLEVYCESVGAKFIHLNQLPFAVDHWPEPGMSSMAHPFAVGNATLAEYIFKPILNAPAPAVTKAVEVMRDRPNKGLLTIADMTRITDVVTALDAEWDQAVELWLFDQSNVANALAGLKTGAVMLPRSGANVTQTVTHDSTSGAEGVALEAGEYLRTTILPSAIGRTLAAGAMFHARGNYTNTYYLFGAASGFGTDAFTLQCISNASMAGYGLADGTVLVTTTTNMSDLLHKVVELRSVELDASNQTVTIYESGVATEAGSTNAISKAYGNAVPAYEFLVNAITLGATFWSGSAPSTTVGAFYVTDGTTTASLWASVLE